MSNHHYDEEYAQLEQGIAALEAQRAVLGDAVVNSMIAAAREKLAALDTSPNVTKARKTDPEVRRGPASLQGERKQVTVIIADVKGSTKILEQIGTEGWVKLMNRTFQILETEIYRFGGEIDQFRGDGLVAFFGATLTHEDDPERAVLASLAMQSAIKRFANGIYKRQGIDLRLRIGVNTGQVIVTNIGDERQHSEDTAMGEAITLAARMEAAADPGTVLVSEYTYRLTQSQFKWRDLGKISVKGLSQPLSVYCPLASNLPAAKVRGIAGLKSPMIGRAKEFETLCQAIAQLQNNVGGIVTIVGEAGLGKSRLVAEGYEVEVRAKPAKNRPLWVEGRCRSYGSSIAYLLWLDILRGLLRVQMRDSPADIRDKLRVKVSSLSKQRCRYPERLDSVYPYLGHLMSLPLETEAEATMDELEGERLKRGTFRAIETLIEGMAQQRPLVIVCEDLHWADPTSLELLERLFRLTKRVPLLFICVLRPETAYGGHLVKQFASQHYSHQNRDLWLVPLSTEESGAMIDNLLPSSAMPSHLKARILNHAEGNPFYVEEIIRALMDGGALVQDSSGHWRATGDVIDISIPPTLYGVLMARIDRLSAPARRVLQLASVIGRIFHYRVLKDIYRQKQPLDHLLRVLQREDLVRVRAGASELEYIFKHYLIREAAYNSLLKQEQRSFHRRVARALERMFPEREEEQVGLLAHHWAQAEKSSKAIAYLLLAGERATAQFANTEAVNYYNRALSLIAEDSEERYQVLLAREKLYDFLGARENQARDLLILADLAEALDDPLRQAEVALRHAHYAEVMGDYDGAIAAAQKVINLARVARDVRSEAAGYLMWGRALFYQGEMREAHQKLEQALTLSVGYPQVRADTLRSLGLAAFDLDQARSYQNQALHIHRKIGDRRGERAALYNLSEIALVQGNYDHAGRYCEQSLRISREIGDRQGECMALHTLGDICLEQGHYEGARARYEQVLRMSYKTGDAHTQARILIALSGVAHCIEDGAAAVDYAQRGVRVARAVTVPGLLAEALLTFGCALLNLERVSQAGRVYQQAMDIAYTQETSHVYVQALAGLADVALARGNLRQAKALVEDILPYLDMSEAESQEVPVQVYLVCVRVLDAHHDRRARRILSDVYDLLQARAMQIHDSHARCVYLERVPGNRDIVALYRGEAN